MGGEGDTWVTVYVVCVLGGGMPDVFMGEDSWGLRHGDDCWYMKMTVCVCGSCVCDCVWFMCGVIMCEGDY